MPVGHTRALPNAPVVARVLLRQWRRQKADALRQFKAFGRIDPTPWHDPLIQAVYPYTLQYTLRGYAEVFERQERPAAWEKNYANKPVCRVGLAGVHTKDWRSFLGSLYHTTADAVLRLARAAAVSMALSVNNTTATRANAVAQAFRAEPARVVRVEDLAKRLEPVFNNRRRAREIAAHEMTNALHQGQVEGGKEVGHLFKTWLAQKDACDYCKALNGQTVPIDEPFIVMANTTVNAPPAHPNCRCTLRTTGGAGGPEFVPHPRHERNPDEYATVNINVRRFDRAWAADAPDAYLPPDAPGRSEVGGRRDDFRRFLATGKPVQSPLAVIAPDGGVWIDDGRHRFAVLRDDGLEVMPVSVPAEQADEFRRRFGAKKS